MCCRELALVEKQVSPKTLSDERAQETASSAANEGIPCKNYMPIYTKNGQGGTLHWSYHVHGTNWRHSTESSKTNQKGSNLP